MHFLSWSLFLELVEWLTSSLECNFTFIFCFSLPYKLHLSCIVVGNA